MKHYFFIAFILFLGALAHGQTTADSSSFVPQYDTETNYTLKTKSGSIHTGQVIRETSEFVVLKNKITHRTVEIRKSEIIQNNKSAGRDLSNETMGENLHARNYMFLSSAFLFDEGKVSTNSHWLLLENINYAFNKHWAITLNTVAFYPISLGLNFAYEITEDNYIGGSVFGIGDITSGGNSSALFGYGAQGKFTHGNSNKNLTFSGGVIGLNSDLFYRNSTSAFVNMAFISAAYCSRFKKNVALNIEGWYLPELTSGFGGIGFKFIGNEVICWTVGCYALINNSNNRVNLDLRAIPVPYFSMSRKFN
ncbi:hypothetical protein [Aurantibacillus circumpalustris]|uniref:hypothetical protein n=1 Tax=Aurantibacillus circumpalustris TaxID=3036359 RepID=UPI00295BA884|nr:hypothetical protein [Aurantibacillus circumpalustris]